MDAAPTSRLKEGLRLPPLVFAVGGAGMPNAAWTDAKLFPFVMELLPIPPLLLLRPRNKGDPPGKAEDAGEGMPSPLRPLCSAGDCSGIPPAPPPRPEL